MSSGNKRPDLAARNRGQHKGEFLYEDAEWMRDAYEKRQRSIRQIAAEAGCGVRTVARWLETHGIGTRTMSEGKQLNTARGADHPSWRGGPPPCPKCGGPKSLTADRCGKCRDRTGELNPRWRGDAIDYPAAHERIKAVRGLARGKTCTGCAGPATEWAYDHTDPAELTGEDGPYSLDVNRYRPMCVTCHRRFDAAHARAVKAPPPRQRRRRRA